MFMLGRFSKENVQSCLRLVTQTLLVPIGLHALATLVLIDLRFPAFLK